MDVKLIIDEYLEEVEIKKCEFTYKCYLSHLNCFYLFCEEYNYLKIEDIDDKFYLNYIKYSKKKNLCAKTINKRIRLFNLCLKKAKINPCFEYEPLKEKKIRFDVVEGENLKKIVNYCYNLSDEKNMISHKLLIFLLLDTGARINEVLNIKINNIDFEKNKILLTITKTDSDRVVYFNKYTRELILLSLKYDRKNSDFLFYNFRKDKDYTYDCCKWLFKKIKKDLNISKLHPHMFRHTFITNLINNGAPVFLVQQLAGHSSIKTTEIYVHQNEKKLEECYKNFSNYSI